MDKKQLAERAQAAPLEVSQRSLGERRQLEVLTGQLCVELGQLQEQLDSLEKNRSRVPSRQGTGGEVNPRMGDLEGEDFGRASISAHFGDTESSMLSSITPVRRCRPTPKPRTKYPTTSTVLMAPTNTPVSSSTLIGTSNHDRLCDGDPSKGWSSIERNDSWQRTERTKKSSSEDSSSLDRRGVRAEGKNYGRTTGMLRRPNIVPDRYNGKTSWRNFLQHFEACKLANEWTDEQAKVFLAVSLQGTAVKVVGNTSAGSGKMTYSEIKGRLEQRFGPGQLSENYLMELRCRRQGSKETLRELGQAIRELATLDYPEICHFSDAIEDQAIREGIFRARPSTR